MAWRTITPEVDSLIIGPVRVTAPTLIYPRHKLVYDGTRVMLVDGVDQVWADVEVDHIDQDDQAWRLYLASGEVWDVIRSTGCVCQGSAPIPR